MLAYPPIERYNPVENTWSSVLIEGFSTRVNHGAVACGNKLLIFGGHTRTEQLKSIEEVNLETSTSTKLEVVAGEEFPNAFAHCHLTNEGKDVILFGGLGNPLVHQYNIEDNKWTKLDNLSKGVFSHLTETIIKS